MERRNTAIAGELSAAANRKSKLWRRRAMEKKKKKKKKKKINRKMEDGRNESWAPEKDQGTTLIHIYTEEIAEGKKLGMEGFASLSVTLSQSKRKQKKKKKKKKKKKAYAMPSMGIMPCHVCVGCHVEDVHHAMDDAIVAVHHAMPCLIMPL
jgi:hypothetical protein